MTTFEPGAKLVLTQTGVRRPFSTAFWATSPAPTMTEGLDVLVQLVIAATTTEPCSSSKVLFWWETLILTFAETATAVPPEPWAFFWSKAGRSRCQRTLASFRGTRSCGRLGPASEGSTVDRSSDK